MPIWNPEKTDFYELSFGDTKEVYNAQKDRRETWIKGNRGDEEWVLYDATPARVWKDRFVGAGGFYPSLLGYMSELVWSVNGVAGGAAPSTSNFVPTNQLGGGLTVKALGGNNDEDYTAIHWGSNYSTKVEKSPHLKISIDFYNDNNVAYLGGLGDATRSTGQNPFTTQDNFIGISYDTDVDNDIHFKIITDGTTEVNENLGPNPSGLSSGIFKVNDDADAVTYILNGSVVGKFEVNLPTVQLQPYSMVMTRDATDGDKDLILQDFRLIMDRGFS